MFLGTFLESSFVVERTFLDVGTWGGGVGKSDFLIALVPWPLESTSDAGHELVPTGSSTSIISVSLAPIVVLFMGSAPSPSPITSGCTQQVLLLQVMSNGCWSFLALGQGGMKRCLLWPLIDSLNLVLGRPNRICVWFHVPVTHLDVGKTNTLFSKV